MKTLLPPPKSSTFNASISVQQKSLIGAENEKEHGSFGKIQPSRFRIRNSRPTKSATQKALLLRKPSDTSRAVSAACCDMGLAHKSRHGEADGWTQLWGLWLNGCDGEMTFQAFPWENFVEGFPTDSHFIFKVTYLILYRLEPVDEALKFLFEHHVLPNRGIHFTQPDISKFGSRRYHRRC